MQSLRQFIESSQQHANMNRQHKSKRTKSEEQDWAKESKFNKVVKLNGYTFEPSIHASSQARDRRPEFSESDWKNLHRKAMWYIKDNQITNGAHLFYSKSMEQGYVATVKGKNVKIITVLPKLKHNPQGGNSKTDLAMMEEIQIELLGDGYIMFESVDQIPTHYI